MPLIPKIKAVLDPSGLFITVYDITQPYNPVSNPTGYGGGVNPDVVNVATATLLVTVPNNTVPYSFNVYPTAGLPPQAGFLPTLNPTQGYVITNTQLGYLATQLIPDGCFIFTLNETGTFNALAFTATVTLNQNFTPQSQCCIQTKLNNMGDGDCGCGCGEKNSGVICKLITLLKASYNAASCGKVNRANKIIQNIFNSCNNSDCKSCNCH